MKSEFANPYIKRGEPVSGERLVGRDDLLKRLVPRLSCGAHCSLVGLPRMGKTSVAREAMRLFAPNEHDVACCYLTLDALRGPAQVYSRILQDISNYSDAPYSNSNHDQLYDIFISSLRKRSSKGQKAIVILDEMDAILRDDFIDAQLFISRIREIANDYSRYGLTFIFISRRSLDMIQGSVDCSTLAGLCEVIYVTPLKYDGMVKIVDRSHFKYDDEVNTFLWNLTGGHPFLTEVIMCESYEQYNDVFNISLIEKSYYKQAHEFSNQYRLLARILSFGGIFDSLCELTVGPHWRDIDPHCISLMKHYGLISSSSELNGGFQCMSQHLNNYLIALSRTTPTWQLLGDTEKQLRNIIQYRLENSYGLNWFDEIIGKHKTLQASLNVILENMKKEKRIFGEEASESPLDYAYISDLKNIIFNEWDKFSNIFSGPKREWQLRFDDVTKVRNPMAHNRKVPDTIIHNVEQACRGILSCISNAAM